MTQPVAIMAIEPNPYSSPPITAAMRTSNPLLNPPSTLRMTLSLSPFAMSVYIKWIKPTTGPTIQKDKKHVSKSNIIETSYNKGESCPRKKN